MTFLKNRAFFDDIGKRVDTDPDFLMALSALESGWLSAHSQKLHNPFGTTHKGGADVSYDTYQAAADYWVSRYASFVQGTRTIDDFTDGLRRAGYNTATPDYADRLKQTLASLRKFEAAIETKP